jgi:hypothetical protein
MEPWNSSSYAPFDFLLQEKFFLALSEVWGYESELVRSFIWATTPGTDSNPDYLTSYETFGKPAQTEVNYYFPKRQTLQQE